MKTKGKYEHGFSQEVDLLAYWKEKGSPAPPIACSPWFFPRKPVASLLAGSPEPPSQRGRNKKSPKLSGDRGRAEKRGGLGVGVSIHFWGEHSVLLSWVQMQTELNLVV